MRSRKSPVPILRPNNDAHPECAWQALFSARWSARRVLRRAGRRHREHPMVCCQPGRRASPTNFADGGHAIPYAGIIVNRSCEAKMLIKLQVYNFATIAAAALLLGSCAGRDARPVAISQPQDATMACAQIQAEITGNNQLISDLGSERGAKVAQNAIVGVAGIIVPVLWFAMDFKGAATTDQGALKQRDIYLASMATTERCGTPSAVFAIMSQQATVAPRLPTATSPSPVSLTPTPVAIAQPTAYAIQPMAATPVAMPMQSVAGARSPPICTFAHASDITAPIQSSDVVPSNGIT